MTKAELKRAAAMGREDIEAAVREMCIASVRADEATARMNEELAIVRQRYEPEISAQSVVFKDLYARVESWALAHQEQFAPLKSIALVHGTIGFRTGQPMLKPVKGMTWEKVLEVLKRMMPAYVRVREEVDKAGLIAAADEIGDENLGTIGLRRHQDERFYAEMNKEAVRLAGEKVPA